MLQVHSGMDSDKLTQDEDQQIESDLYFNQDDDDKTSVNTFGKRGNTSEVWDYFDKIGWEEEKKMAKCKLAKCIHKAFSCGKAGTTRPLWRHLEISHWTVYIKTDEYQRKRKLMKKEGSNVEELLKKVNIHNNYYFALLFRLIFYTDRHHRNSQANMLPCPW